MTEPALATPCHCQAVRQAARQLTHFYDHHLAPTDLRTSQYGVLAQIERLEAASINRLAEALGMDRTTLGRALRPLQRDGLVVIGPGADGRTRALRLTEAGQARLAAAFPLWRRAQDAFEAHFGAEEARSLHAAMTRLVRTLPG